MSDDQRGSGALDPAFFEGRILIDILTWDWNLRVAIMPAVGRSKSRFQGLQYDRDFTIQGRIRAPAVLRGAAMRAILSPFGPRVRFGRGGLQQVGSLQAPQRGSDPDFEATLMLPEEAIPATATSLASTWKHLQIDTFDESSSGAKVSAYFFHSNIHPNLRAWADAD